MLNDQEISLFQELYQKRYGILLSIEDAVKYGTELINFIEAIVGHPAKQDANK